MTLTEDFFLTGGLSGGEFAFLLRLDDDIVVLSRSMPTLWLALLIVKTANRGRSAETISKETRCSE